MQTSRITRDLKPVYLLASGEPLLLRDWLDQARQALREAGFEDIQNLQTDAGFDWDDLLEEGDMMSLFSASKCRIVTMPGGKPGVQGARAIQRLCENPAEDSVYIFVAPSLDWQSRKAAWYKNIQATGEVVELKPIDAERIADWLMARAREKGLDIDAQSAQFLADRTEGNLLAADQELEKLSVRFGEGQVIGYEIVEASVAQSARYSHFLLVDACLAGNMSRALKILKSLRAEGYVTARLRWALQDSLQQLDQLQQARRGGSLNDRNWRQLRIWGNKQNLYKSALSRLGVSEIENLLQSCATLDRLGKGQQDNGFPDQDWFEIESLVIAFSGKNGNGYERGIAQRI